MTVIKTKTLADILQGKRKELSDSQILKQQHFALVQDIFTKTNYLMLQDGSTFYLGKYKPDSGFIATHLTNDKITEHRLLMDSGNVIVKNRSSDFIELSFKGKSLKDNFIIRKSKNVQKNLSMRNMDKKIRRKLSIKFSELIEPTENELKQLKHVSLENVPVKLYKGIALAEGVWNGDFYPWKVIKNKAPEIIGIPIYEEHKDIKKNYHGNITKMFTNDVMKELGIHFLIITKRGQELIDKSKKEGLSVTVDAESVFDRKTMREIIVDFDFVTCSLVESPACKKCWIDGTN